MIFSSSRKRAALLIVTALLFPCFMAKVNAQGATPSQNGPVHEAFVTAATEGGVILQSIALAPPAPVNENRPPQCHVEAIWIPGYWAWVDTIENFVWVSGVWRKPPPGHVWISGYWNKFEQGWAWVRGFWSPTPENKIVFIPDKPNEPKREQIPTRPGKNYFWMPGYWAYDFARRQYNWLSGAWTQLDANWVYVPAYYLWRPNGYIFIPGYWDLNMDARGCAYAAVTIPPQERGAAFTPTVILTSDQIINWCYAYYPDYVILILHNWYFYPAYWEACGCVAPWWTWSDCWCFSWADNWWLWWWWTNPDFPNPPWITIDIAVLFPPPPPFVINIIDIIVTPPPIVIIPWGVVPPWILIDLLGGIPIMPIDPPVIVVDYIKKNFPPPGDPIRPTGKIGSIPKLPPIDLLPPGKDHVIPPETPSTPPPPPEGGHVTPPETPVLPPTSHPTPQTPIYPTPPEGPIYYPPEEPINYPPSGWEGGYYKGGYYTGGSQGGWYKGGYYRGGWYTGGWEGGYYKGGWEGGHHKGGYEGGYYKGGYEGGHHKGGSQGGYYKGGYEGGHHKGGSQGGYFKGGYEGGHHKGGSQGGWYKGGSQGGYYKGGSQGGHHKGGSQGGHHHSGSL